MSELGLYAGWKRVRAITAADTALAATTLDSKPAGAFDIPVEWHRAKELMLCIAVDGADGDSNVLDLYAGANENEGPSLYVGRLTTTAGLMEVNTDPETLEASTDLDLFVDSITVTTDGWPSGLNVGPDNANDRMQVAYFDLLENRWLYVAGQTINSTKVTIFAKPLAAGS